MSAAPRSLPALLCAGLASIVLAGAVTIVLWTRVDDVRDRPIVTPRAGAAPAVVPLTAFSPDGTLQRLTLHTAAADVVLAHDEIDLALTTGGGAATIVRGTLAVGGCLYATVPGARVESGVLLRFLRTAPCDRGLSGPAAGSITMRLSDRRPLSVWVFPASGAPPADALIAGDASDAPADAAPRWMIAGRYVTVRAAANVRRVNLLNYVWQIAARAYWIGGVLAAAGALMFAGTYLCVRAAAAGRGFVLAGGGAGCVALALGLLHAVLVPPFEAPDEPDHFLAFADLAGRPELKEQAVAWARLGHLQRIATHGDERFRPIDVVQPHAEAWSADVFPLAIAGRSRTTYALWTCLSRATRGMRAPAVLLTLRVTNALVLAIAVAAGVALIGSQAPGAAALSVAFAFLLVPTLPFFGTHASDFAILTSTYVLLGCIVAALVLDGPDTHWLGLPIGLATTLALAGGRSAGPMIAFIAAALAARATLGTRHDRDAREALRHAAIFWLGAAGGMLLLLLAASDEYTRSLFPPDTTGVPPWIRSVAEQARTRAWWLAIPLIAGIGVELAARALRLRARTWLRRPRAVVVRLVPAAIAVALVLIAAASLVIDLPVTRYFNPLARPPLGAYVGDALATLLTSVRLRHPDLLLSTFFWGGFGWLDAILPQPLVAALLAGGGALAIWLLAAIRRSGDERRAVWLAWLGAGWLAAFALTAVASYYLNRNLHGRYLMGVYLTCLAVVATAPAIARESGRRSFDGAYGWAPNSAIGAVAIVCAALHAFALSVILSRYF